MGIFNARDDEIAALTAELARKESDNAALANRLQTYSDTLVLIRDLKHYEAQTAMRLAREALES